MKPGFGRITLRFFFTSCIARSSDQSNSFIAYAITWQPKTQVSIAWQPKHKFTSPEWQSTNAAIRGLFVSKFWSCFIRKGFVDLFFFHKKNFRRT